MSFLLENYTNLFFCFLKITLLYMLIDQSNLNVCYGCFVELYINTGDCRNLDTLGWGFLTSIVPYNICFFDLSLALFCFHRRRREREREQYKDRFGCVCLTKKLLRSSRLELFSVFRLSTRFSSAISRSFRSTIMATAGNKNINAKLVCFF